MKRWVLGAVLAAGCTDFEQLGKQKPAQVTMRVTDIVTPAGGGTPVKIPLPKAGLGPCILWVDRAFGLGWLKLEGSWVADGECVFHGVPPGERMLSTGLSWDIGWLALTRDEVDMGDDFSGRAFVRASAGTAVTFDLTNADPFSKRTLFGYYLRGFGLSTVDIPGGQFSIPDGQEGKTGYPITADWERLPVLRADEEIDVFSGTAPSSGAGTFGLSQHGLAKVAVVDGRTVRTSAPMSPLPTRLPGFLAVDAPAQATRGAQKAQLRDAAFGLSVVQQQAVPDGSGDTLTLQATVGLVEAENLRAPATAVDPFPDAGWTQRLGVITNFIQHAATSLKAADGGRAAAQAQVLQYVQGPATDLGWLTTALVTGVRNLDALYSDGGVVDPIKGVLDDTSVHLRWDPPATGTPNRYYVQAYTLQPHPTLEDLRLLVEDPRVYFTYRPEVRIPPTLLKPETRYVFIVTADACAADDPARPSTANLQPTCGSSQVVSDEVYTGKQ